MVTVHPLGGCAMAEDGAHGVVDHEGRVFRGRGGRAVHAGLYVCDGAVVPRALGVNPLLTIAALAERFCVRLMRRQGWTEQPRRLPGAAPRATPGLLFTEAMRGTLTLGSRKASPLRLVVTALAEDLEALLTHPAHAAELRGTVEAPALSPRPLTVGEGRLQLFVPDDAGSRAQTLRYRLALVAEGGQRFLLEGVKQVGRGGPLSLWRDTTTLQVRVWRGEQPEGRPLGEGQLRLGLADLSRQLRTLQAPGARGVAARTQALSRFVGFFGARLAEAGLGLRLTPGAAPPERIPLPLHPQ